MKIAIISPPWIPLPPDGYGGIENVVFHLSEGLRQKGHDVYVYATGDSRVSSNLKFFYSKSLGVDMLLEKSYVFYFLNHVYYALKNLPPGVEVIHNHCEMAAMHLMDDLKIPFVHTLHGALFTVNDFLDDQGNIITSKYSARVNHETLSFFKHHSFVSISSAQRKPMPYLNFIATVYNSVDTARLKYNEDETDDNILWFGRFSPQKGLEKTIDVANSLKKKLVIGAKVHEKRKQQFNQEILSRVDNRNIRLIGEIKTMEEKSRVINRSKLFLMPIQWEEPFGLVMIESMACGTPVVAFARGSVPEIVKDGQTGFIVNSSDSDIRGSWIVKKTGIEGLCEAVERIYAMPTEQYQQMRKNCRAHVEKNFTVERMVDEYEKVYQKILRKK